MPQLKALEELNKTMPSLKILLVPSNDFSQEPVASSDIEEYYRSKFTGDYYLADITPIKGEKAHPLFKNLKEQGGGIFGSEIKWNFTKFLIGKDARLIKRYAPTTSLSKVVKAASE